jgi:hypothetical protein
MRTRIARIFASLAAVGVLGAVMAVPALADPRDFTLANNTSFVVANLYVAPSDSDDWGTDILGRDVLNPTETASVTFGRFDGVTCMYDVKVVGQEGQLGVLSKVDLCTYDRVNFSDAN